MDDIDTDDIDIIRIQIRTLDDIEARGISVTAARAYWCQKAVDWAKKRLTHNPEWPCVGVP